MRYQERDMTVPFRQVRQSSHGVSAVSTAPDHTEATMAQGNIPHSESDAFTAGYLRGGPAATVSTVAAALIARKVVAVARGRRLVSTVETVPDNLSELEQSVLRALDGPMTLGTLRSSPEVRALLSSMDRRLTGAGLVPPKSRQAAWRSLLAAAGVLSVWGVVQVFENRNAGEPFGLLAALVALIVLATIAGLTLVRRRTRRTAAGDMLLNELRQRYAHLRPTPAAPTSTNDPEAVAWSVALFGGEVVPAIGAEPADRPNMGASTNASAAGGGGAGGGI
jgi:uncharacterized protein (TIGR04222 family)